jgi:hypothetical protein
MPRSIERWSGSTCSAGQAPSQGICPLRGTDDGLRVLDDIPVVEEIEGGRHRIAILLAEEGLDVGLEAELVACTSGGHGTSFARRSGSAPRLGVRQMRGHRLIPVISP